MREWVSGTPIPRWWRPEGTLAYITRLHMLNMPYQNTPTVVVVLVPLRGGLLMIRGALVGEG